MILALSITGAVIGGVAFGYFATRGRAADREALAHRSRLHPAATAGVGAEHDDHDQEKGDDQ